MLKCPMCEKNVPEHEKTCGKCGTDVSLLVNYIDELPFFCDEVLPRLERAGLREKPRATTL